MNADPIPHHFFASVAREEVWSVTEGSSRLLEERRESGFAAFRGRHGIAHLIAGDHIPLLGSDYRALVGVDPAELFPMLEDTVEPGDVALRISLEHLAVSTPLRLRVIRRARYVSNETMDNAQSASFVVVTAMAPGIRRSIVCTEDALESHLHLFAGHPAEHRAAEADPRTLPILWSGGSASILLHEALGHPSERGIDPVGLPSWLRVTDRPSGTALGSMSFDDCGSNAPERLLSAGERPGCFRRESFRAIPFRRMTNLHATVEPGAPPIELPGRFIAARLIGEGGYDPLRDRVTLAITAAELVDGERSMPLGRFVIEGSRTEILRSLVAGEGSPIPYPGVMCGEDGQRLPVGSEAPLLLSRPWANR